MYYSENMWIDLKNIIEGVDNYYAHSGEVPETLTEHTDLCKQYFMQLLEKKKLKPIIDKILFTITGEISKEAKECLYRLYMNIVVFHDIGKVNAFYQMDILKHKTVYLKSQRSVFAPLGTSHSMLSAVCYMNYFIHEINMLTSWEEKQKIRLFLVLNAYVIAKHHGRLKSFNKFVNGFKGGNGETALEVFNDINNNFYIPKEKDENLAMLPGVSFKELRKEQNWNVQIAYYAYEKLTYSLLITSDYYATSEYNSGVKMNEFGNVENIRNIYSKFSETGVSKSIAEYEKEHYRRENKCLQDERNINILRNEMYLDAKYKLLESLEQDIFFLEAPTGSGKSNTAFNLSFLLLKHNIELNKIFYVYPFNTLIEQNVETLEKVFDYQENILKQITVINSSTPIKVEQDRTDSNENIKPEQYVKALLDRQFLNYPIILTTHVSLFDMMFGNSRDNGSSFYQLANSVIVLDEIQSYKNSIWSEIIIFLKQFAKLLNIKVIIMSATLPNLDLLTGIQEDQTETAVRLLENREKYFSHSLFRERVHTHYELMDETQTIDGLAAIILEKIKEKKKILIEFIKKASAEEFSGILKNMLEENYPIEYMSGDDSVAQRQCILERVKNSDNTGIILVATQVVEAGVDIDMDLGYKNYSKLDSEEQFMGRINRGCKSCGDVYFFDLDDPKRIYKNDIRMNEEFTIKKRRMQEILKTKEFSEYYRPILEYLKKGINQSAGESGLEEFFSNQVGSLDFEEVKKRMKLIDDDNWSMNVFLARCISVENNELDGAEVWEEYVNLLENYEMDYSEKQVRLSQVKSKMNNFIYQIKKNDNLCYSDKIGDLYYIEDGDIYFEDNKLVRKKFQEHIGLFIDL